MSCVEDKDSQIYDFRNVWIFCLQTNQSIFLKYTSLLHLLFLVVFEKWLFTGKTTLFLIKRLDFYKRNVLLQIHDFGVKCIKIKM